VPVHVGELDAGIAERKPGEYTVERSWKIELSTAKVLPVAIDTTTELNHIGQTSSEQVRELEIGVRQRALWNLAHACWSTQRSIDLPLWVKAGVLELERW